MIPLSYNIPEWVVYRDAALALHDVAREISAKQNAKDPIARKIMPALIEKRDRLAAIVAPLKDAADAAERAALERMTTAPVMVQSHSTRHLWQESDGLGIPAFLRRQGG
jgi:formate dehydrogenase maturation protein FdhE